MQSLGRWYLSTEILTQAYLEKFFFILDKHILYMLKTFDACEDLMQSTNNIFIAQKVCVFKVATKYSARIRSLSERSFLSSMSWLSPAMIFFTFPPSHT